VPFLPHEAQTIRFINADLIAAGLSLFAPEDAAIKAGPLMLRGMAESVARGGGILRLKPHWPGSGGCIIFEIGVNVVSM